MFLVSCIKRVSANDLRRITSCRLWQKKIVDKVQEGSGADG